MAELIYTSATRTDKPELVTGPKRLRYRKNRQAAAERQFLALRNTKPGQQSQEPQEQNGQEESRPWSV
jgi:hypothetical protein